MGKMSTTWFGVALFSVGVLAFDGQTVWLGARTNGRPSGQS